MCRLSQQPNPPSLFTVPMPWAALTGRKPLLACLILIVGCAGAPPETPQPETSSPVVERVPVPLEGEQLDTDRVEQMTSLAKSTSLLVARHERNLLSLDDTDASTLVAIDSRLAWLEGDLERTDLLLDTLARDNTLARDFVLRERELHAVLAADWLSAAELVFQRAKQKQSFSRGTGLRRDGGSSAESDRLFGYLLRVDLGTLRQQRASSSDPEWQSWLEMLIAYRSGPQAFASWRASAGLESANLPMPAHLVEWSDAREIARVALLLPLDGDLATAGEAVVAGAMEQLYRLYPDPSDRPALSTVDVSQYSDIRTAYEDAANTGANIIIGPLTKASVADLQQLRSRRIPVIALNQPDTSRTTRPKNWMSLSLAPEDESRQIADIAFGKGCRNAIVMGQDSIRGRRLLGAFEDRWLARGGQLRGTLLVDDPTETNAGLGKLLGSGSSDQRIRAIENAFDLPVDARGRGRSDFECIFMLAPDAATARAWRPLLVFHMTGSVPVYATSAINDGLDNTRNRDLNGVLFVETPAMLPPNTADRLGRLRALGGDALTLAQHWNQINATEQWVVQGQTGLLRRKTDGAIERALDLATFDRAQIRREPLP